MPMNRVIFYVNLSSKCERNISEAQVVESPTIGKTWAILKEFLLLPMTKVRRGRNFVMLGWMQGKTRQRMGAGIKKCNYEHIFLTPRER